MMNERLIEETRNGWLECEHRGAICGVDQHGRIRYAVGDTTRPMFLRSAAKPLQAIPVVRSGMLDHFQLEDRDLALMTASHRGEAAHVDTLEHVMEHCELHDEELICSPSLPLHEESREALLRKGGDRRRMYHNCAGKHFGVLAWSKMAGMDMASYADPAHPAQRQMRDMISYMSEVPQEAMIQGTDGCGFPVYGIPLTGLATAYLKLACPDLIGDATTREAAARVRRAMQRYPFLVGGTDRVDTLLMEDDNIVAKGGFKGIFAFALTKERLGFAFKIADGSDEEWALVTASILEQIGYERQETVDRLRSRIPAVILNDNGRQVGEQRTVFVLKPGT